FFSSRRRHTRFSRDWSSDVCSSDLAYATAELGFLALDTAGQMAMRLLAEPVVQIVDPDSGQVVGSGELGEVVVTNFSRGYPLIQIGRASCRERVKVSERSMRRQDKI